VEKIHPKRGRQLKELDTLMWKINEIRLKYEKYSKLEDLEKLQHLRKQLIDLLKKPKTQL
jgi:hypothetical protein